jgi:hypothetical protein
MPQINGWRQEIVFHFFATFQGFSLDVIMCLSNEKEKDLTCRSTHVMFKFQTF